MIGLELVPQKFVAAGAHLDDAHARRAGARHVAHEGRAADADALPVPEHAGLSYTVPKDHLGVSDPVQRGAGRGRPREARRLVAVLVTLPDPTGQMTRT